MDPKELHEALERGEVYDFRRERQIAEAMRLYRQASKDGKLAELRVSNPELADLVDKLHSAAGLAQGTVSGDDLRAYHDFSKEKHRQEVMFVGQYNATMGDSSRGGFG
jgi:hypothetical protein